MKKTYLKLLVTCCLLLAFCLLPSNQTRAEVKSLSATDPVSIDLTEDGKKDTLIIKTTMTKEEFISNLSISINGKKVLNKSFSNPYFRMIYPYYAKLGNGKEVLQIMGIADNDYCVFNEIYRYQASKKSLVCVLKPNDKTIDSAGEIIATGKNSLTIKHHFQPQETGYLDWKFQYKFNGSKFVLTSSTTDTVKSAIGDFRKDSYSKKFKKNQFVTAKKLSFYNGSKLSFRVPANKTVTLKKITISKEVIYLQFQYGKKNAWIHVNRENYDYEHPWFKAVNGRLAG